MKRPTIRDVARQAGVSVMTASRAINNQHNVSDAAARQVEQAVRDLGYQKNTFARGLHNARSFMIVMLIDPANPGTVGEFQRHVVTACREAGYHLLVDYVPDGVGAPAQFVEGIATRIRPDGFILWPPVAHDRSVIAAIRKAGSQCVCLNASPALGVSTIGADAIGAGEELGRRLGRGDRPVVFFRARDDWLSGQREEGLRRGLAGAAELLVRKTGQRAFEGAESAAAALFADGIRPAAIVGETDRIALGALHAAAKAGFSHPRDIAVAAFDDTASARLSRPRLMTVEQPLDIMARQAVGILDCRLEAVHYTYDFSVQNIAEITPAR